MPTSASKKAAAAKKLAATKKAADTSWQDSTYKRQMGYYGKVAGDFAAQQIRNKGETAQYYGTEATPESKKAVTKTTKGHAAVLAKKNFDKHEQAVYRRMKANGHNKKANKFKAKVGSSLRVKSPATKTKTENVFDIKKQLLGRKKNAAGKMENMYKTTKTQKFKTLKKAAPATGGLYQHDLEDTRKKDMSDIKSDYAARGVIHSGLYAKKVGDYNTDYGKKMADVSRKKTSAYQTIASDTQNFNREQQLQKETARLDAIRRKAASTGTFLS